MKNKGLKKERRERGGGEEGSLKNGIEKKS